MKLAFNPKSGNFEFMASNNFSFNIIPLGKTLCVPQYQQMIVHGELTIQGDLKLDGDLVIL